MQCPSCQHDNPDGLKFCNQCGTPLSGHCDECGFTNQPGSRFCGECGTLLVTAASSPASIQSSQQPATQPERDPVSYTPQYLAEKILTSRSALEGERKQVTVMFADIKDSTELIRDLDPEAAQQLLDPAIHIMMDAVHRFEGTVNQVLGDGIMAIFGAPIAHEDHAARACYAALAMQSAMETHTTEVRQSHGLTLRMRVGLNAGEAVVRTIGNDLHMDYSAVGPTTHLAARMEQLADPGSIVLTASTLRLVEGFVRVNALGAVPVKGITEPVEVYELTGASTNRRRLQAAVARGLTRFVGRETEIEVLNQARQRVAAGNGQIVAAVGEAGVGKSRLVYEFIQSHRTQDWRVLESASVSYGKATPYFPIVDLLKRYAHVEEGDDTRTIRAKVTGQILTLDESLQETVSPLLSLLDALPEDSPFLQVDPPQRRQRTFNALKRVLLRESQVQPLLLVFEDLHWIDSETQALLDSLVESLPTAEMLLLVNYRPEYQHAWGSKTYYTQLRLGPLPPTSADEFLAGLIGNDSSLEPLKTLLIKRTEGNPFFLEESVRTLVETQVLAGEPGAYRLAQELPSIQVPTTVQAILAARIDRLPQEEKQLLQTAAVIGTEVPFTLLVAIADLSEEALYCGLTRLQAAEFLYETSLYPERTYTFKHALTHEVAYRSLLQERRRTLHAHIVEALEAFGGDRLADQVERLAYHAFRGEVWGKALRYYSQAGDKASGHSAYREAVVCFEHALGALKHLPESCDIMEQAVDLHFDLRNVLVPLQEYERAFDFLREAEILATVLDDHHRLGWVYTYTMAHFFFMRDYDRAIEAGQRAIALAEPLEEMELQVAARFFLGAVYYSLGENRRAIEGLRQNVACLKGDLLYQRVGLIGLASVWSRTFLVMCLAELGAFDEAMPHSEEALRIVEAVNHPLSLIVAYRGVGALSLCRGEFGRAIAVLERGLALCQSANIPHLFSIIALPLSSAYARSGRATEAIQLLMRREEYFFGIRDKGSPYIAGLSEAYLMADQLQDAIDFARQALKLSLDHKERGTQAYSLRLLGEIAMRHGPPDADQAETHYRQSLALANELGMRPLQAHCHRGFGIMYGQTGQAAQARAELSTAIEMYRDMEMSFWLPDTEAALAQLEGKA